YVCDAALLRLALGERDLHLPALEPGPPRLPVDERLLEPQRLAVERASRVEVAHAVPDGHSARAGLSTSCFSVRRKSAPTAPSIARWSHVSVNVISGLATNAPFSTTTRSSVEPTARIATCGGLSTATNCST